MSAANVDIKIATVADLGDLLSLVIAFKEHLQVTSPSKDDIRSTLEILLADPMCEFVMVFDRPSDLGMSKSVTPLAYAHVRYFHSLWSAGLEAQLEDLFVSPETRGRGLGAQLLTFLVEGARQRQCRLIVLNTNENNIAALNLYGQQGFSSQRSRWQGGHQLWLEKIL